MSVAVIAVIAVLLVLGMGLLIFTLMRKSQAVVPQVTDQAAANRDRVVEFDDQGREIMASREAPEPARDSAAFEDLLKDEIHDLGHEQPAAEEEG